MYMKMHTKRIHSLKTAMKIISHLDYFFVSLDRFSSVYVHYMEFTPTSHGIKIKIRYQSVGK